MSIIPTFITSALLGILVVLIGKILHWSDLTMILVAFIAGAIQGTIAGLLGGPKND